MKEGQNYRRNEYRVTKGQKKMKNRNYLEYTAQINTCMLLTYLIHVGFIQLTSELWRVIIHIYDSHHYRVETLEVTYHIKLIKSSSITNMYMIMMSIPHPSFSHLSQWGHVLIH